MHMSPKFNDEIDKKYNLLSEQEKNNMFTNHKKKSLSLFIFISLTFIIGAIGS